MPNHRDCTLVERYDVCYLRIMDIRRLAIALLAAISVSACVADTATNSPNRAPTVAMPEAALQTSSRGDAMRRLGVLKIHATDASRDVPGGVALVRRSAEMGEPQAYFWLGILNYQGTGMPRDYAEAYRNFRIAWEGQVTRAALYIGRMHANGFHLVRDVVQARHWYELAAARGDAESQYSLSYSLIYGSEEARENAAGLVWLRRAVDAKYPAAVSSLARLYEIGKAVPADIGRAAALYQEASDLKDPYGTLNLGVLYLSGRGVPRDDARAVALFRQAIALGYLPAKSRLAWMYENGRGVPRDLGEARRLYAEAAGLPAESPPSLRHDLVH